MPDPAEILARLYADGFDLETFDRFPQAMGVSRDGCIALLVPAHDGLQVLGAPGWKLGESIGVLTTVGGKRVFQAKTEIVEATPERLAELERFTAALKSYLRPPVV